MRLLHIATLLSFALPLAAQPKRDFTDADVQFMQGMIGHHAQALVMARLIPQRTSSDAMQLLGERIIVSQKDEIATMRAWLVSHGQAAPNPEADSTHGDHADHAMHQMNGMAEMHHEAMMPGMLTPAQLDSLRDAKGVEFERRFLTGMIRHHEGALAMVAKLFASQGAAQNTDVFRFASDVDTDQRAEIARMQQLLATLPAK